MKNYLDLVPISAKVRKKQNRMSVFCIILSVFLVTAIFGMADMFVKGQILQAQAEDGNWHIAVLGITKKDASLLSVRPDIKTVSAYNILNFHGDEGYTLSGKSAAICGCDESIVREIFNVLSEGTFPQGKEEALVSQQAKEALGLKIGDSIAIRTPSGQELPFTISGFTKNIARLLKEDSYGVFLSTEGFHAIDPKSADEKTPDDQMYYLQFSDTGRIQSTVQDLKKQFGWTDDQMIENTTLLGLLGQSGKDFMKEIYGAAVIFFFLVLFAGIMMIASSLNSNVAQRIEFFGLVRCIGATPKQVMRLVRREALRWCYLAIPAGVAIGMVLIWILCFILRILSPMAFGGMPVFGVSLPSIAAGVCIGLFTVLLAARSPAKKASKVSPLAAVSGNAAKLQPVRHAANTALFKVDTALGIHHAKSSKKNFILMVGSFSLSMVLFLSFSVTVDLMKHALTPLHPWNADLSIAVSDRTDPIDETLLEELQSNPAVAKAYGRMSAYDVPAVVNGEECVVDLVTHEENQFGWAKGYLLSGSVKPAQNSPNTALVAFQGQNTLSAGDTITLRTQNGSEEIEITGVLSDNPAGHRFGVNRLICSESTFKKLTGKSGYTIIDIHLSAKATENDVAALRQAIDPSLAFLDYRMSNSNVRGVYYCFALFVYGFLALIALITILNVVNSIAMSVASRMKQYGAFRAIGLSSRQLAKMIVAEAATYAVSGSVCGSVLGLICNKILFDKMITFHWGNPWSIPFVELGIITVVVTIAVLLAVRGPIGKIRRMSIVDTISAL